MLANLTQWLFPGRRLARDLDAIQRHIESADLERAERLCIKLRKRARGDLAIDLDFLLGQIALRQGHAEAAIRQMREALSRRDADPVLHIALADACRALPDIAAEAVALGRALELLGPADPRRPGMTLRIAESLQKAGRLAESEGWYRRLLESVPDHPGALLGLATLREAYDVEEARAYLDRYIVLRGDAAARLRRALILPSILQSEEEIERVRQRLDQDLDEVLDGRWKPVRHPEYEIGSTAFALAYHGRNDRALLAKLGRACRAVYPARIDAPARSRAAGRRLRVGFVSMYFHFHSIARTHSGFITGLPRERFEVYVFAIAPRNDDWAAAIRSGAEHYVALPLDLDRAREAIEAAGLDVLLYTDLGMDPYTYFLAFWRLAPVQLVSWGHPVTTGVDTLDHFVSAAGLEPAGSEDQYTESLVRLPGFFLPRYRRPQVDGPASAHAQLGVPAGTRLYCCLQTLFKLHPDFDPALRAILEGDEQAVIVLLESSPRGWTDQLQRRLERSLGRAASRVRFVPRMAQPEYQRFVAAAHVVLDPFHFGGANSTCEALALGVPVVTLPAFQLRGRFTLGLYDEMGIADCVAGSPEEYVGIALRLGRDAEFRDDLSRRIAERSGRLFERTDAGAALGEALQRLAESRRAGL